MAKNILAFFGLIFLTLLIVTGVGLIAFFYDSLGLVSLPESLPKGLIETPMHFLTPGTPEIHVKSVGKGQWFNPLDLLPTPTETPIPLPSATPVPPMDPADYRAGVLARTKRFAAAMEKWLDANNALAQDSSVKDDPEWQNKVKAALEDIRVSAEALADVGPAPQEYAQIDSWLKRIPPEAQNLQTNYQQGLNTGGEQYFVRASDNFERIKQYLTSAAEQMVAQGWSAQ